jgi:hypothetical protein
MATEVDRKYRDLLVEVLEECDDRRGPCEECPVLADCDSIYVKLVCDPDSFSAEDYELVFTILLLKLPLFNHPGRRLRTSPGARWATVENSLTKPNPTPKEMG